MFIKQLFIFFFFCFIGAILPAQSQAQYVTISGTIYDISARRPIEAVAVLSTNGRGTISDSLGRYIITVPAKDSIWFMLMGKSTMKYPVDTITNLSQFNIMIHVRSNELPEVKVRNNNYRFDSAQNRKDYAKIFDFKKPTLRLSNSNGYNPGGVSVGFDINEIINMFRFDRNKRILNLQKRLLSQEEEKYINNRFSKQFVRKLTKLSSPELENFMTKYRPEYAMVQLLNDLELGYYITQSFKEYQANKYQWRGGKH